MYGKVYEPKNILHKKGKRHFAREVVKEVDNGEDLFAVLFARNIKGIKQQAKYESRTEQNGKTKENIVSHSSRANIKVNESVKCGNLMDSFDALLREPSCQPPDQEFIPKRELESIDKNVMGGRRKPVRKKSSSVLVINKENMPNSSEEPVEDLWCLKHVDERKETHLKFFRNGLRKPSCGFDVEPRYRKKTARERQIYKLKPNDSYVDSCIQSSDEFVDREYPFLQNLLPKTLSSQDCLKEKSSSTDCNPSNVIPSPVYKTTSVSAVKLSVLSSTPARLMEHSNYVSCVLSPIENVENGAAKEQTIHRSLSDSCTDSIISSFEGVSLSCKIDKSVSKRNGTIVVDQSEGNSGGVDYCQRNSQSPDPFLETVVFEDNRDDGICNKNGLSVDRWKESIVKSDSDESPTVLRGTSRSKLNTTTVSCNSEVHISTSPDLFTEGNGDDGICDKNALSMDRLEDSLLRSDFDETPVVLWGTSERSKLNMNEVGCPSSCQLGQVQQSRKVFGDNNETAFSGPVFAEPNITIDNRKPEIFSTGDDGFCENIPHSPSVSNVTSMTHDSESQIVSHQKPTCNSHCGKSVIEPSILKESPAFSYKFPPRRSHAVVPLNVSAGRLPSTGFRELYVLEDELFADKSHEVNITFKNKVLQYCGQTNILGFTEAFPESNLYECKKIGEGVYGEVFSCQYSEKISTVLKIIPIEGDCQINGESQKSYEEILSEIVITVELSNLRNNDDFYTSNFPELIHCWCVQGEYPAQLLALWHEYNEEKTSENDSPEILPEDQIYIILELANVGSSLESYTFTSAEQSLSAFMQVASALAVAEVAYDFEHRDLHWGNILIKRTNNKKMVYKIYDSTIDIECHKIQASVIDFTLSRMTYDGCCIYNNLANDPAIFEGNGDYQFDIYRMMKDCTKNNWQEFEPYNNVLWLSYVLRKLLGEVYYRNKKSRAHRSAMAKLRCLNDKILDYKSALDVALSFS